jgi:hypothetical protein
MRTVLRIVCASGGKWHLPPPPDRVCFALHKCVALMQVHYLVGGTTPGW